MGRGCAGQGSIPKSGPTTAQAASAPKRGVGPTSGPLRRAAGCTCVFKDRRQPIGREPRKTRATLPSLDGSFKSCFVFVM